MRKTLLAAVASAGVGGLFIPIGAQAAGVVSGTVPGPDTSFSTVFEFLNEVGSTLDITSLTVDGSFATPQPLVWDMVFDLWAPPGATVTTAGEDSFVLTFDFGLNWNPGEMFRFAVDPDTPGDSNYGATVFELRGTRVTFGFSDASSRVYEFVDDPARGAGLVLAAIGAPIPEPVTWAMMIMGLGAVGAAMRRTRADRLANGLTA